MIQLITGKRYGIAHTPADPCCHFWRDILRDGDRVAIMEALEIWNHGNPGHWFLVVRNPETAQWERVPEHSPYTLFSED